MYTCVPRLGTNHILSILILSGNTPFFFQGALYVARTGQVVISRSGILNASGWLGIYKLQTLQVSLRHPHSSPFHPHSPICSVHNAHDSICKSTPWCVVSSSSTSEPVTDLQLSLRMLGSSWCAYSKLKTGRPAHIGYLHRPHQHILRIRSPALKPPYEMGLRALRAVFSHPPCDLPRNLCPRRSCLRGRCRRDVS
jgi:hypothetical protein